MGEIECSAKSCQRPRYEGSDFCSYHMAFPPMTVTESLWTGFGCVVIIAVIAGIAAFVIAVINQSAPTPPPGRSPVLEQSDQDCPEGTQAHLVDQGSGAFIQCY